LTAAGALLGLAALAKGLVPVALAIPAMWIGRRRWRDLWRPALAFAAVALPWNLVCYWMNGRAFVVELYWRHHVERLISDSIQHVQSWWFFIPVLLAGMFPWTPMIGLLVGRKLLADMRLRLFAAWAAFGFLFFSIATNKLPGYILPLMPAIFALIGVRLAAAETRTRWLPAVGILLGLIPVVGAMLPKALAEGISTVRPADLPWRFAALGIALSIALAWALAKGWKQSVMSTLAALSVAGVVYLKATTLPALEREASARPVWRAIEKDKDQVCLEEVDRQTAYGLHYYSLAGLPDCIESPRPIRISAGGIERRQ
jgi:4-amino-4-deoxy-L-arabinose transferase-like glycosyltransferase